MAGSVNKVILVGNLGKDPEVRRLPDGRPMVTMRIATTETWRDKNTSEKREKTEWHSIVIFNEGLCRVAEQYLKKGAKIYVEGQLQTRKWQDQQGADRYSTEVVLQNFNSVLTMLDSAASRGGAGAGMSTETTAGGMHEGGQSDYGAGDGGYSGGGGGGFGGGGSSYGDASRKPASSSAAGNGNGNGMTSRGGAKPFDKKLDDEIPF